MTYTLSRDGGVSHVLKEGERLDAEALVAELNALADLVDRAHEALNDLLHGEHNLNIGDPARQVAVRGIWGEKA